MTASHKNFLTDDWVKLTQKNYTLTLFFRDGILEYYEQQENTSEELLSELCSREAEP